MLATLKYKFDMIFTIWNPRSFFKIVLAIAFITIHFRSSRNWDFELVFAN